MKVDKISFFAGLLLIVSSIWTAKTIGGTVILFVIGIVCIIIGVERK